MNSSQQTIETINHLYQTYGSQSYEENCTQLQHAEQSGTLALEWGCDEEVALAAFLHDIGHFIAQQQEHKDFTAFGCPQHDEIGANFLKQCGFSKRIQVLVGEHVNVKRYLAATQKGYIAQLSAASLATLEMQGGPMTEEEVIQYRETPFLDEIIKLRKLDDCGKRPEMACKGMNYWLASIREHFRDSTHRI